MVRGRQKYIHVYIRVRNIVYVTETWRLAFDCCRCAAHRAYISRQLFRFIGNKIRIVYILRIIAGGHAGRS